MDKLKKYCRSCGRNFKVKREEKEHFVEVLASGTEKRHPRVDCEAEWDWYAEE